MGRTTRAVGIMALGFAAFGASGVARAGTEPAPSSSGVTVEAATVFGNDHDPGEYVPVAVMVSASQLVSGTLSVLSIDDGTVINQPIEVAGGSVKAIVFVAPTVLYATNGFEIQLMSDDRVLGSAKIRLTHDVTTSVAGVLPALAALTGEPPPKVNLGAGLGDVVVRELDPALLDLGPAALDQLDHIVGTSADYSGLTPARRAVLQSWVATGGRLLIDDAADLSFLPPAWLPNRSGYALAGQGEIRLTDGGATAGNWKTVFDPVPLALVDNGFGGGELGISSEAQLARRAGVTVPDLGILVVVLAVYAVAVGPILYLALRRLGRLTLAWLAIPALAVSVAAGVLVVGRSWRSSGHPAASTFVETNEVGSVQRSMLLLFSRSGGTVRAGLPSGWSIGGRNPNFGPGEQGVTRTETGTGDRRELSARLESGQVVVFRTVGAGNERGFDVSAAASGARTVEGTVRNTSAYDLHDVAVFATASVIRIGDLAAGATSEFKLTNVAADQVNQVGPLSIQVWTDADTGFGNPFGDAAVESQVDLGLWSDVALTTSGGMYQSGMVRAVGWTDERPSEFGSTVRTRTAISTVAPIGADDRPPPSASMRTQLVSWPNDGFGAPGGAYTWRFVLPTDAASGELVLDGVGPFKQLEVRTGDGWEVLEKPDGGRVSIGGSAVRSGALVVRGTVDPNQFFDGSQMPTLSGRAAA